MGEGTCVLVLAVPLVPAQGEACCGPCAPRRASPPPGPAPSPYPIQLNPEPAPTEWIGHILESRREGCKSHSDRVSVVIGPVLEVRV